MQNGQTSPIFYLVLVLVVLPILYFRLRRTMRPQALKLNQIWTWPAIYMVIAALALTQPVPGAPAMTPQDMLWLALAALLGAAAGWQMGRIVAIHVHPENGTLMATGGQAAAAVIVVLVVLRLALRTGLVMEAPAWHLNATLIIDASIVFAACMFAVRGLEMFLRARRVMLEQGAKPRLP